MPLPMLSTVLWWVVLGMLLGWLGSWMFNRTLRTRVAERGERAAAASIATDVSVAAQVEPALALRTLDSEATSAASAASTTPVATELRVESATRDEWPATIGHPPATPEPGPAPDAAAPEPEAFDLAAAVAAGLAPRHPDDLEVIDGIGARIAALLRDEGVTTWRALADSSPERLRDLLDLGGPGFRIADPTSWPVQAALAADGRWADLKALQGLLAAGRG